MPRTVIAVQNVPANGNGELVLAAMDAANGMKFQNDGRIALIVHNTDASPHEITVVSKPDPAFGRTGNIVKSVLAADLEIIGFLNPAGWNQVSGVDAGAVQVDVDVDTGMLVAAVRLNS